MPTQRDQPTVATASHVEGIRRYGYRGAMRATIDIPDDLHRQVKSEAALRGLTIREVTTQLYRGWPSEDEGADALEDPKAWRRSWLNAADEALGRAPGGRSGEARVGCGAEPAGKRLRARAISAQLAAAASEAARVIPSFSSTRISSSSPPARNTRMEAMAQRWLPVAPRMRP